MSYPRKYFVVCVVVFVAALLLALYLAPFMVHHWDYTLGFITCFVLFAVGHLLLALRNYFSKPSRAKYSKRWIIFLVFFVMAGLVTGLVIKAYNNFYREGNLFRLQSSLQRAQIVDVQKNVAFMPVWLNIEDQINDELNDQTSTRLSQKTIDKIVTLSQDYIPYQVFKSDSIQRESPQRGRLLINLLKMGIDSSSFAEIVENATFEYAELANANLDGAPLAGINLNGANLQGAKLNNAVLVNAQLKGASLWSAKLNGAKLSGASLSRSNLEWAELKGAVLDGATLDGAQLSNAILSDASLINASVQQAELISVKMENTSLNGINLYESDLTKSSFNGAALTGANLRNSIWTDASLLGSDLTESVLRGATFVRTDFTEAILAEAFVMGANWYEKLEEWEVVGRAEIISSYDMQSEASFPENFILKPN